MPTQEKVESVEDLKRRLSGVKTVLLAEYRGLTVQQLSDLRKQLRSVSAEYKVVKNRLAKLALSPDLAGVKSLLKGPTGMIISKADPVAVAKALHAFARTNQALVIKAGYVEGQMLQPAGLCTSCRSAARTRNKQRHSKESYEQWPTSNRSPMSWAS